MIENTLAHRYCAEVFCFVRKASDIYDKAVVSTAGICRTSDTVRTADAKECAVNSRYIRVRGLDHSPEKNGGGIQAAKAAAIYIAPCAGLYCTRRSL